MPYNFDYFISYAHKDNVSEDGNPGFVDAFVEKLQNSPEHQQMFGGKIKVFFDKSEIQSMSDWDNRIRSGLASSRFFVVLLSPNYFHSEYCAREFDWWMQHEMHRRVLGEGTAPMLIVDVNDLYNFNVDPIPEIPQDLQVKFPNWVKQIRQIQAGPDFDMHNLDRLKIDEILRSLCEKTKDKVFKQNIAESSPINAGYPQYNENFVGRRENLRSLRQTLSTSCTTAISAVNGLGGIGKTELALTYGHAFAWDYELGRVFATCENADSLEGVILSSSIAEMYGIELKGTNEQQLTTLYNTLKSKIYRIEQRNEEKNVDRTLGAHLLLILDNVNRLELISRRNLDKLPNFFHVIITTRESSNKFPHIHTESVERLSEDESVELLSNLRAFGDDPQEAEAARNIAKLLEGFTLAVELTGSYLGMSPRVTYQKQYERLNANISGAMEKMVDKTQELRRHQAECISVVLESTLSALSDNAHKALEFASLMPPDAVGFGWLPELIGLDEDDGWEALDELTGYSLLSPLENEPNIARIHRLVAEAVKKDIPEDVQKEMIAKIREKCNELLKKDKTFWCTPENSWNITPVFEFCLALAEQWKIEAAEEEIDWGFTEMLDKSGQTLKDIGKIDDALSIFKKFMTIANERASVFSSSDTALRDLGLALSDLGELNNMIGNMDLARDLHTQSYTIRKSLAQKQPNHIGIQCDLADSCKFLGDIYRDKGDSEKAKENYSEMLYISEKFKASQDKRVLQNLSISYVQLGKLEKAVGNTNAAREWFKKSLDNDKLLVKIIPDDVKTLRGLNISYEQLGLLEEAAGNTEAARELYEKILENDIRLTEQMPENVQAQRDLSFSYMNLGVLENAAGNAAAAREWYEKSLEIRQRLADLMPDNVTAQRDLSALFERLGDLEQAAGNATTAREWYEKLLEICNRLANKMPDNVQAQRDLSISYERLGNLEQAAGNAAAAREYYEKTLEISKRLAEMMPNNVNAQRDLSVSYNRLGALEKAAGNVAAARKWYEKALEIDQRLAELMPDNVQAQRDLSVSYCNLGDLERNAGNLDAAREWYEKALEIDQRLAELMPDNVQAQKDLAWTKMSLAQVQELSMFKNNQVQKLSKFKNNRDI